MKRKYSISNVGVLIILLSISYCSLLIKTNQDLIRNSNGILSLQNDNDHFDRLSFFLGTLQGDFRNFVQQPALMDVKKLEQHRQGFLKEVQLLSLTRFENKDYKLNIKKLHVVFNERSALLLERLKAKKRSSPLDVISFLSTSNDEFGIIWASFGLAKDQQRQLLAVASLETKKASLLSWRISVFGSIFLFIAILSGYFIVSKSRKKQKTAELKEQESEAHRRIQQEQLQAVIDNSTSIIFIKDKFGKYTLVNERFKKLMNLPYNEIIGKSHNELTAGDFVQYTQSPDEAVLNEGEVQERIDKIIIYKEERDFLTVKFPLRNEAGEIFGLGGIATDITDRTRYENELKLARKSAEDAKRAQEQFLANISHELRSPINGVVGISNLLELTDLNKEQKDYLDIIRHSSNILVALINNILDLSKMQAGMLELEKTTFDFASLLKKTVKSFQAIAEQKGIEVVSSIDSEIPQVLFGDPTRLSQIISNIYSNAVKFTYSGRITISAHKVSINEDLIRIEIKVTDTGIGIPYEARERIFESYVQSHAGISGKHGGTGLGLAIVKQLVDMQNGEIHVESEPGTGSTFTVILPFELSSKKILPEAEIEQPLPDLTGKHILVIEDNLVNQRVARESLESAGVKVDVADDGFVGLFLLKQKSYDVILLDINMPGMNGYETARKIRKELRIKTPIIAVTANALKENKDLCFKAEMDGFITKPYSISELLIEVGRRI